MIPVLSFVRVRPSAILPQRKFYLARTIAATTRSVIGDFPFFERIGRLQDIASVVIPGRFVKLSQTVLPFGNASR